MKELIGKMVMNRKTKERGIVTKIKDDKVMVSYSDVNVVYSYPAAFADILLLADSVLQKEIEKLGAGASFDNFKKTYSMALHSEIDFLRQNGGKKYRAIDGERLESDKNIYVYSFETDAELHFPDGTVIKIWFTESFVTAYVISCEEFTIVFQSSEYIGESVESIEFSAESWQLMESLIERLNAIDPLKSSIAYEVACMGISKGNSQKNIAFGQDYALRRIPDSPVTFIWGPPGTGKTRTLSKIAQEAILNGKRVLMLSYSNVSVDGALLRLAKSSDYEAGQIIRYGYPRIKELLESTTLTSYAYVLSKNLELKQKYQQLLEEKRKLKKKDIRRTEILKKINKIRQRLMEEEKELIQNAAFVATTVSKAVVDKAVYMQKFEVVIFDEASMAYVPQIVFAASLAKESFCCLGDFRQLPAIVQNSNDVFLTKDIFEYTGITDAVENHYGHEWLVMLNVQYRMHPEIAKFVSQYMYENMLQSAQSIYEQRQLIADCAPLTGAPMGMIDLSSTYSVCIKTMDGSRINLLSSMICMRLAELLSEQYEVGIITPYSAQSRLILAMIRDLQERKKRNVRISCATVHQFQGSEKPVILYDAVDCFRMPYPGTLLTSKKNDIANRLFNVALTRTQGKFILIANKDYLFRKNISKDLLFTKVIKKIEQLGSYLGGEELINEIGTEEFADSEVYLGDRDDVDSWERYLQDIEMAQKEIIIDIPGAMDDDDAMKDLFKAIKKADENGVIIYIRTEDTISLPKEFLPYRHSFSYITTPLTIIDKEIVWFGEPLSAADFISEGNFIETESFPCLRFKGKHTARILKAFFEIPTLSGGKLIE